MTARGPSSRDEDAETAVRAMVDAVRPEILPRGETVAQLSADGAVRWLRHEAWRRIAWEQAKHSSRSWWAETLGAESAIVAAVLRSWRAGIPGDEPRAGTAPSLPHVQEPPLAQASALAELADCGDVSCLTATLDLLAARAEQTIAAVLRGTFRPHRLGRPLAAVGTDALLGEIEIRCVLAQRRRR